MRRRLIIVIAATEALVLLTALYFEPSYCVRGWLDGEAFYEGRPTSWWRAELESWDVQVVPPTPPPINYRGPHVFGPRYTFSRRQTMWEKINDRWLPRTNQQMVERQNHEVVIMLIGPSLLHGVDNEKADLVLRQLLDDPSPKIRQFARIGLKMDLGIED